MGAYGGGRNNIPFAPNLIGAAIITTAGAVVTADWPGASASGLASTSPRFVEFDAQQVIAINLSSTNAAIPTTNSAGTTASSGRNIVQAAGHQHIYRIPQTSTGYSVTAPTSGAVSILFWHEGGQT